MSNAQDEQKDRQANASRNKKKNTAETPKEKAERVKNEREAEQQLADLMTAVKRTFETADQETQQQEFKKAYMQMEEAVEAFTEQVLKYIDSESLDRIVDVFPNAREWAKAESKKDPFYALDVLNSLYYQSALLPDYMAKNEIADDLEAFTTISKNEDGQQSSELNRFLEYANKLQKERAEAANAAAELSPPVYPTQRAIMTDKIISEMLKGDMAPTPYTDKDGVEHYLFGVNQAPANSQNVAVFFGFSGPDGEPIKTSRYLEPEDLDIIETEFGIMAMNIIKGRSFPISITPEEIWRQQNGITDKTRTPSPKQRADIIQRMYKLRHSDIYMDFTAELNAHYLDHLQDDRITEGTIETYLVPADFGKVRTQKGRKVDAFIFDKMPFLLKYCMSKGHVQFIDNSLLDTSDTTDGMEGISPLRRYLLKEITLLYQHKRNNTTILYDTIYKNGGIKSPEERADENASPNRTEATRAKAIRNNRRIDRERVCAILESWTKRKYILGYEQIKEGSKYTGVKIRLNPKNYEDKTDKALWTDDTGRRLTELF